MTDEELFEKAAYLRDDELQSFLSANCQNQAQLERIKCLLAADQTPDSLLDTTAMHSLEETYEDRHLPKSIGDFEILGELGRGGMGVVYEARQKSLKRKVALKVLSSGLGLSSKAILRFRREAEAAGKLHHTNIVPIYITGEDKGIHFYAMELIDGPSLDQVIKERQGTENPTDESLAETASRFCDRRVEQRSVSDGGEMLNATHPPARGRVASNASGEGPSSSSTSSNSSTISTTSGTTYFDEVATMIADVAEALDHAHEHGVIHRDVKPSNLLLGPDGRLSINDFGLARMLEQPGMTVSGEFVGSPLYMSPEQITAGRVQLDHRTDIYSLGATLYELLTHQPPFPGQSRDQVLSQILHKEPISPRKLNRKIPVDLDTICMKAIDKDPDRRYQTAGQLADDLRKYVNRHAISARRTSVLRKCARWVARHPSQAFLIVLLAASLVAANKFYQNNRTTKLRHEQELHLISCLGGDTNSAEEHMLEAERQGASKGWLLLAEGQIRLYEGDYESAFNLLDNALKNEAPSIPTRTNLTIAQLFKGDEKTHESDLKYISRLLREGDLVPKSSEDYLYLAMAFQYAEPLRALDYLEKTNQSGDVYEWIRASAYTWAAVYEPDERKAVEYVLQAQAAARSLSNTYRDNPRTAFNGIKAEIVASICFRRTGDFEQQRKAFETANEYIRRTNKTPATNLQMVKYLLLDESEPDHEKVSSFLVGLGNDKVDYYAQTYRMIDCIRTGNFEQVELDIATIERDREAKYPLVALTRLTMAKNESEIKAIQGNFRTKSRLVREESGTNVLHADLYWAAAKILDMPEEVRNWEQAVENRAVFHKGSYTEATHRALVDVSRGKRTDATLRRGEDRRALTYLHFALGVDSLSRGDRVAAKEHFVACSEDGNPGYYVCQVALAVLARWEMGDSSWPKSIPQSSEKSVSDFTETESADTNNVEQSKAR